MENNKNIVYGLIALAVLAVIGVVIWMRQPTPAASTPEDIEKSIKSMSPGNDGSLKAPAAPHL